jgi:hypothetical protein
VYIGIRCCCETLLQLCHAVSVFTRKHQLNRPRRYAGRIHRCVEVPRIPVYEACSLTNRSLAARRRQMCVRRRLCRCVRNVQHVEDRTVVVRCINVQPINVRIHVLIPTYTTDKYQDKCQEYTKINATVLFNYIH